MHRWLRTPTRWCAWMPTPSSPWKRTSSPAVRWPRPRSPAPSSPLQRASGWRRAIRTCCRTFRRRWSWMGPRTSAAVADEGLAVDRRGSGDSGGGGGGGGGGRGGRPGAGRRAPARRGDFSVIVRCRGELKASRSIQIIAPVNVPSLRIVWQAPPSGAVKQGDPEIRFDPSSTQQQLQEKDDALKQAQASLEKATAESHITAEQDHRDLSTAKYDVERARLEASKFEIVSKLQGEEGRIDMGLP